MPFSRPAVSLLAVVLAVTGCSSSDSGDSSEAAASTSSSTAATSTTQPNSTTTEPTTTEPVATQPSTTQADPVPATTAPSKRPTDKDPAAEPGMSVTDALRSLPAAVRGSGSTEVAFIDWDRFARSRGLEVVADAPDGGEARRIFTDVVADVSVERGGDGIGVLTLGGFPEVDMYSGVDDVEAELGFSLYSIRSAASIWSDGSSFSVLTGDLPLGDGLVENTPDVFSAGDLPDDEIDITGRTAARPLGRTLHLARHPDDASRLGVTRDRSLFDGWPADGTTLADVPIYAEAGAALDLVGATTATMIEGDYSASASFVDVTDDSVHITESFRLVGIGAAISDGRAMAAVVYQFDDEATAERALDGVERAWTTGESITAPGTLISDMVDVLAIGHQGGSVTVVITIRDDQTTTSVLSLLYRQEAVFLHR